MGVPFSSIFCKTEIFPIILVTPVKEVLRSDISVCVLTEMFPIYVLLLTCITLKEVDSGKLSTAPLLSMASRISVVFR